ncbi:unnamed protein product [Amoebophrya sp. A25]|nr:unnamed protein product [Amoebophrya sp. A25]|eukprot:GSA25T00021725001.1
MEGANTPEQWYKNLPVLTRYGLTIIFATTILVQTEILNPQLIVLHWPLVWGKLQLWRVLTCVFFFGGFSFNLVFQLYFFTSFSSKLERNEVFASAPGEYLLFLLFQIVTLAVLSLLLAYPTGLPTLGPSLVFAIIYYWSRREPYAQLSFFSFTIQGYQFPFALLFFQVLMGGSPWADLLGLGAGHIYYFLKEVVPQEYGYTFIRAPAFMQSLAIKHLGAVPPRGYQAPTATRNFQGPGQRLGG